MSAITKVLSLDGLSHLATKINSIFATKAELVYETSARIRNDDDLQRQIDNKLSSVSHDSTLSGDGTSNSPIGVSSVSASALTSGILSYERGGNGLNSGSSQVNSSFGWQFSYSDSANNIVICTSQITSDLYERAVRILFSTNDTAKSQCELFVNVRIKADHTFETSGCVAYVTAGVTPSASTFSLEVLRYNNDYYLALVYHRAGSGTNRQYRVKLDSLGITNWSDGPTHSYSSYTNISTLSNSNWRHTTWASGQA